MNAYRRTIRSSSRDGYCRSSAWPNSAAKRFSPVAAEIDDAAAGRGVARGPFQFGEPRHDGRAQRASEMMPPLAPVETGLADRAARMGQCFRRDLQRRWPGTLAFGGELDLLLLLADQPLRPHAVEHLHAEIASEMIVANPRAAQRRILWPGAHAHMTGARGKARKPLQYAGDIGIAEAIIAVPALFSGSIRPPASSFERCELAVCGVTPAWCASSLAVSARPVISAVSMLARAGSPTREATIAISGPAFMVRW